MNGRFLVAVQEFDGVFDRQNVIGLVFVHLVEDRGECGGLAGACGTGHEDDAIAEVDDFLQRLGKIQFLKSRNLVWNHAHDYGAASTLPENVHAKASDAGDAIGKVSRAILLELALGRLILSHNVVSDIHSVLRGQALEALVF